ncbi:methyltransferase domain-containing protein [Bradyrhizobium jicamae]|uniref:Methyltransferase domain-containing protein n=1 Tax=Bradyrhizobium jicamae TaxID=280332 RepID=A0ABS5FN86_9BRAD|nr:methyltransferase domain-containing protein [Bradyrhizobium jicamae]MBR0798237.1 methyltransferase domain-containing protein [Bradyrhizobium jicamae]
MSASDLIHELKWAADGLAAPLFKLRPRPFGPGYQTVKRGIITSAIDAGLLQGGKELPLGYGIAMDERVVEYPWVYSRLSKVGKMLDAGSTFNHDYLLQRAPLRGADLTIMTLAPERRCYWRDGYSYVFGDLRKTMFDDQVFDTIASISTIEHIGLDNQMLYTGDPRNAEADRDGFVPAVKEFRRILRPGGVCLISVPYGKRDNLGWYQVFDRAMIERIIEVFGPTLSHVDYFGYTRNGWSRQSAEALADATIHDVHSGKGRGDDLAASSRAVACLQLTA